MYSAIASAAAHSHAERGIAAGVGTGRDRSPPASAPARVVSRRPQQQQQTVPSPPPRGGAKRTTAPDPRDASSVASTSGGGMDEVAVELAPVSGPAALPRHPAAGVVHTSPDTPTVNGSLLPQSDDGESDGSHIRMPHPNARKSSGHFSTLSQVIRGKRFSLPGVFKKQRYHSLNVSNSDSNTDTSAVKIKQVRVAQIDSDAAPSVDDDLSTVDSDAPVPCSASPLLLCITVIGLVFIACGIAVAISASLRSPREEYISTYNTIVSNWNHGARAAFRDLSLRVRLTSADTLDLANQASVTDMSRASVIHHPRSNPARRLFEDSSDPGVNSSTGTEQTAPLGNSAEDIDFNSSAVSSSSTASFPVAFNESSSSSGSVIPIQSSSSAASVVSSTGQVEYPSTGLPLDSSTTIVASSTAGDSSTGAAGPSESTGAPSVSSTGASPESSTAGAELSSTGAASTAPPLSPSLNSPSDPWLFRNYSTLYQLTSGEILREIGAEIAKYQPLYYSLNAAYGTTKSDLISHVTPVPTVLFPVLPTELLRNHSLQRHWVDREDFSLNRTRVSILVGPPVGSVNSADPHAEYLNTLELDLPLIRQDVMTTTKVVCTSHMGLFDSATAVCTAFKQLNSICVRIKSNSHLQIQGMLAKRKAQLQSLLVSNGSLSFDPVLLSQQLARLTTAQEHLALASVNQTFWSLDSSNLNLEDMLAGIIRMANDSAYFPIHNGTLPDSTLLGPVRNLPHWSDIFGTVDGNNIYSFANSKRLSLPGCTHKLAATTTPSPSSTQMLDAENTDVDNTATASWEIGTYVPILVKQFDFEVPSASPAAAHERNQPDMIAFDSILSRANRSNPVLVYHRSLAGPWKPLAVHNGGIWDASSLRRMTQVEFDADAPAHKVSIMLLQLNLTAFNVSVRYSPVDPYFIAQLLSTASLWFGLPVSEIISFVVILIFTGTLLEIVPAYHLTRWYSLRRKARESLATIRDPPQPASDEISEMEASSNASESQVQEDTNSASAVSDADPQSHDEASLSGSSQQPVVPASQAATTLASTSSAQNGGKKTKTARRTRIRKRTNSNADEADDEHEEDELQLSPEDELALEL